MNFWTRYFMLKAKTQEDAASILALIEEKLGQETRQIVEEELRAMGHPLAPQVR